jgi:hypothetical protein
MRFDWNALNESERTTDQSYDQIERALGPGLRRRAFEMGEGVQKLLCIGSIRRRADAFVH